MESNEFVKPAVGRRNCKSCNRPLLFAKTPEGKIIPLDTVAPIYIFDPKTNTCEQADNNIEGAVKCYVTHFATCPKASEFSKKKTQP